MAVTDIMGAVTEAAAMQNDPALDYTTTQDDFTMILVPTGLAQAITGIHKSRDCCYDGVCCLLNAKLNHTFASPVSFYSDIIMETQSLQAWKPKVSWKGLLSWRGLLFRPPSTWHGQGCHGGWRRGLAWWKGKGSGCGG